MLSDLDISELQQIVQDEAGIELTAAQAREYGEQMLETYRYIYKPRGSPSEDES
jgi:hypothetical protein